MKNADERWPPEFAQPVQIGNSFDKDSRRTGSGSNNSSHESMREAPFHFPQSPVNGRKASNVKRKLVVIGDGNCGKTSLLYAHKTGKFTTDYVPTVFENSTTSVALDSTRSVDLSLWDTAGI